MENKDLIHKNFALYVKTTIYEAKKALLNEEVPIGAIIVDNSTGKIVARAHNLVENKHNALNHAEILVISKACKKLNSKYLMNHSIFVSLEPCPMCAMAISLAKISNLYFFSDDKKGGAVINGIKLYDSAFNIYKPKFSFEQIDEVAHLIKDFFIKLRKTKKDLKNKIDI